MKHLFAVVLFAIIAGLAAWQIGSEHGLKGLPTTVRHALGLPEGAAVAAKFESVGIEAADVKAKVAHVVAETKAKVAEVAEKAVEAAKPDRSESVTPAPEQEAAAPAAQEAAPTEQESAAAEPAAPSAEESAPAAPVAGVTHYYGESNGTAVAAWAGAATMNPDYEPADATGASLAAAEPAAPAAEQPAATGAEPQAAPAAEAPTAEAPAEPAAPAAETMAEAVAPAAEEAPPAPTGVDGQTSYFGLASKPDSDQPWAAAAAPNADYAPGSSDQQASAPAAEAATEAPAPQEQAQPAAEEAPPAPTGGDGQTSYFGFAKMPDEDQPWSAAAAMNPDYTPGAASAPAEAPAEQAATTPEPAAEAPQAPAEESPPAPTGEKGVSSFFGIADKADATQPWAAAAAMNPDYTAVLPSRPVESPATQEAVEACRDALNAEAQIGGLKFAIQRWDVTPENYGVLDKIAKLAKDCGGVVIEVRGHTDNTGKPKSNQTLSDLRAKAVITYLTKAGVPLSKLKAVGFGEDKPVGDNATAKGRAENRRIEFAVIGG